MTPALALWLLPALCGLAAICVQAAPWPSAQERRIAGITRANLPSIAGDRTGRRWRTLLIAAATDAAALGRCAAICQRAGWRGPFAPALLVLARRWGLLAGALLAAVLMAAGVAGFQAGLLAAGAGWGLPRLLPVNAAMRRRQRLEVALPDAVDLLVICAEAGLSLDVALARVGRELGQAAPDLAGEFALTAVELGFLARRADAFDALAGRAPLPMLRALCHLLVQTERYGTPLAQGLRVLAQEFRTNRMLHAEEKAARLPAIMTVPMIAFILPPLFVVLIGPAVIQVLGGN